MFLKRSFLLFKNVWSKDRQFALTAAQKFSMDIWNVVLKHNVEI